MNADYNPQLGKRRTLFPDREDYLVNVEYIQEQGDGLVLMVRTAQDRSAAVRAEFLTDSAVRLKMFTFPEEKERNAVFDFDSIQAEHGNAGIRRPYCGIRVSIPMWTTAGRCSRQGLPFLHRTWTGQRRCARG